MVAMGALDERDLDGNTDNLKTHDGGPTRRRKVRRFTAFSVRQVVFASGNVGR